MNFRANSYVHHRAMREVWRNKMPLPDKRSDVPCKRMVHPVFSTSFGLHITVITADAPQEILFFQRENTGKFIFHYFSLPLSLFPTLSAKFQYYSGPLSVPLAKFSEIKHSWLICSLICI